MRVLLVLLLSGCAGPWWDLQEFNDAAQRTVGEPDGPVACPGHWHHTFQVWVDDEMVTSYGAYSLENQELPLSMHMHAAQQQTTRYEVHWEPSPAACVGFGAFLEAVDTHVTDARVVLGGHHSGHAWGGTHEAGGVVSLHRQVPGAAWEAMDAAAFNSEQPPDGSRYLVLFGAYTPERVQEIKEGVPVPPSTP